MIPTKKV